MLISTLFSLSADLCLTDIHLEHEGLVLVLRSKQTSAACPECAQPSTHVHGHYTRRLSDLPCQGNRACSSGSAPLCVPHSGLSSYYLCGTLPDADAHSRSADAAASRCAHGDWLRAWRQSRSAPGEGSCNACQPRYAPAAHPQHCSSSTRDPTRPGPRRFRVEQRRSVWHAAC